MKPWSHALVLAWMALLAACGPGVGGSGTGQTIDIASTFGAQAASVCSADIADRLDCAATAAIDNPTSALVAQGTQGVLYTDHELRPTVMLEFAANSVELREPCRSLQFRGDWGQSPTLGARFFGSVSVAGGPGQAASLTVVADIGKGNELSVLLQDAAGQVLLGPVSLTRRDAPAPAPLPAC